MILQIYTIYDEKALCYSKPMMHTNEGVAVRDFRQAVNSPGTPFSAFPEDFVLFHVGTFDDNTGEIVHNRPTLVCNGMMLREQPTFGDDQPLVRAGSAGGDSA